MLTSRERVRFSLNHQEPDRVPIDLGGTYQTSIVSGAYAKLLKYLNIEDDIEIIEPIARLVDIKKSILDLFGVDTIQIVPNSLSNNKTNFTENEDYYFFKNEWGIDYKMSKNLPRYFDMYKFPLAGLSLEELKKYKWPDPSNKERYIGLNRKAKSLYDNTDKAIVATFNGAGVLEMACWTTGTSEFLTNMMTDKKKAEYVLSAINDIYINIWSNYLNEVGDYIEVCACGDDLGTQSGPMISEKLFCSMVKPYLKRLIEAIKKKTKAKIYFHSDGDINVFVPHLIEIGVDILNPIQVSAVNMNDTKKIKKLYGKSLSFWGAGCDASSILPFGSVDDVKKEVIKRLEDLAPTGGYVFSSIHNIQSDIKPENIVTMFKTALNYGKYEK